jgi:hypothetical protein
VLAACALTRHVGIALGVAAGLELLARRRWMTVLAAGSTAIVLILPWVGWLAIVRENTQASLVGRGGLPGLIATQGRFYLQRLPDQLTGPFVEIGTVFLHSGWIAAAVNTWAVLVTAVIIAGWARTLRSPRRRLVGLIAFTTMALLLVWPFTEAGRFLIPLVPCLLVGAVEGLAAAARCSRLRRPRTMAAATLLAVSLPYAGYAVAAGRADAQRRTHAEFDAACNWIATQAAAPGPIMARHPGEVYWQTGRLALSPPSDGPESVARAIARWHIAYLLVDEERYANAPKSPLSGFVQAYPARVGAVWSRTAGRSSITLYQVIPAAVSVEGSVP